MCPRRRRSAADPRRCPLLMAVALQMTPRAQSFTHLRNHVMRICAFLPASIMGCVCGLCCRDEPITSILIFRGEASGGVHLSLAFVFCSSSMSVSTAARTALKDGPFSAVFGAMVGTQQNLVDARSWRCGRMLRQNHPDSPGAA